MAWRASLPSITVFVVVVLAAASLANMLLNAIMMRENLTVKACQKKGLLLKTPGKKDRCVTREFCAQLGGRDFYGQCQRAPRA